MKNKNSRSSANLETISERFKRLRIEAGLTGTRLAELTGTKQSRISDIENGKGYLYADELPVYASALKTTVSYLVTGNKPENEAVSDELGLSDKTINRLSTTVKKGNRLFADAINLLFSDSDQADSIFMTNGEMVLALFAEFANCPDRELVVKTMNFTNPAFTLTKDEALKLRLMNALSIFKIERMNKQPNPKNGLKPDIPYDE